MEVEFVSIIIYECPENVDKNSLIFHNFIDVSQKGILKNGILHYNIKIFIGILQSKK